MKLLTMKHTEAEITAIVKKLMVDLNRTAYLEDIPFEIRIENNVDVTKVHSI